MAATCVEYQSRAQIAVESSTELREIPKKLSRMQISIEKQKAISTNIDFEITTAIVHVD